MTSDLKPILLKNGFIVDGSGSKGFLGNLLIQGKSIAAVSRQKIPGQYRVIDCTRKTITPGFIDMHSHNDWFLPNASRPELTAPFTEQGITTFVGGNCGFSAAGLKPNSAFKGYIEANNLFKTGTPKLEWASMAEYGTHLKTTGITHNLSTLAGHGTIRASVCGGNPDPLTSGQMKEVLYLLEKAMEEGAKGISFGFQYAPGIFARKQEIRQIADLVKRNDKILTVHQKAYSSISAAYPLVPLGKAHNLIALEEMLNLARETGVRLQLSHLIFVGTKTWKTFDRAMALIDQAMADGVDLMLDTYAYHCGASIITVLLPDWFMAKAPASYTDKILLFKVRLLAALSFRLLGFGFDHIQIASAVHGPFNRFNGMFLSDIAKARQVNPFENYMDFIRQSQGTARVLMHRYTSPEIVDELIRHKASLLMTDAWAEPDGLQNPAAYGCFPRFIEMTRDRQLISKEQVIHKMTGASARRFNIGDRGILKKGQAADINILDWDRVRDNTTLEQTDRRPSGVESVFINGVQVVENGRANTTLRPGLVI